MYKKPNIFREFFSFAGTLDLGQFWADLAVRVIEFLCASIISCILVVVVVPGDEAQLISVVETVVAILGICWAVSIVGMTRKRLRDAGRSAKCYLWLLLPVIGWVAFIVCLCGKSK